MQEVEPAFPCLGLGIIEKGSEYYWEETYTNWNPLIGSISKQPHSYSSQSLGGGSFTL